MEAHQETQANLNNIEMKYNQNIGNSIPPESVTEQKKDQRKKTTEGIVILGDSTNIVKVKPKRLNSIVGGEKNNENSVQPFQNEENGKIKTNQSKFKSSEQLKISKLTLKPRDFLFKPVAAGEIAKFSINRLVGFIQNDMQFRLQGKSSQLIVLEKKFTLIGNKIILKIPEKLQQLSTSQIEHLSEKISNPLLGHIQSNFDGSIFNLYETDEINNKSQLLATFEYFADVGKMGSPRKIKIYIKNRSSPNNPIINLLQNQNLKQYIQRTGPNPSIHSYTNQPAKYNQTTQTYNMNFNCSKQILPSVHNMILINSESIPVVKLFKSGVCQYDLELRAPMIPLVGCAFVVSSFLFKFVSQ